MKSLNSSLKIYRSSLALPLLLSQQISEDSGIPLRELDRRDRAIARENPSLLTRPIKQLWFWLQQLSDRSGNNTVAELSERIRLSTSIITSLLFCIGVFSGVGAILALCRYDGNQPVNIVFLLGFYFVVQIISLSLFFFSIFPGLIRITDSLSRVNVGYLLSKLISHFPGPWRDFAQRLFGTSGRHYVVFRKMQKWLVLYFAQIFATAFYFGSLVGFLILVSVSDVAFSWSSTLEISSSSVRDVTNLLSTPWADSLPEAVPGKELIESSRYYRLENTKLDVDARIYGLWWPFITMCLLAYGFIPRLVLWTFSYFYLNRVSRETVPLVPGVSDVLDRMNNSSVSLSEVQENQSSHAGESLEAPSLQPLRLARACVVFNWSNASDDPEKLISAYCSERFSVIAVGGSASTEEDARAIESLSDRSENSIVLVLVKSWEPPRGDFFDFLVGLRKELGEGSIVNVVPVSHSNNTPEELHLRAWNSAFSRLTDPWLKLCSLEAV